MKQVGGYSLQQMEANLGRAESEGVSFTVGAKVHYKGWKVFKNWHGKGTSTL